MARLEPEHEGNKSKIRALADALDVGHRAQIDELLKRPITPGDDRQLIVKGEIGDFQ